jgi:hypothetical protein
MTGSFSWKVKCMFLQRKKESEREKSREELDTWPSPTGIKSAFVFICFVFF